MDNYTALRALAKQHRAQYDEESMARAQEQEDAGMYSHNMFSPTVMTRIGDDRAASQADFNPGFDAFFEAVQGDAPTMPVFGGRAQRAKPAPNAPMTALRALGR